jgi:hypothetical protein
MDHFVYRSPTLALVDETSHEVGTNKKTSLKHLRVFVMMLMCMFQKKIGVI